MNALGRTAGVILACCCLWSCGTTHQLIPREPIAKGEWRYSVVWHWDVSGLAMPTIVPDLNLYAGLGKGYSAGFGVQFPFFVSHLTTVKYFDGQHGDYWAGYLHANRLLSTCFNPYVETGAAYMANNPSFHQVLQAGVGYSWSDSPSPFFKGEFRSYRQFYPVIKYRLMSDHWGVSYEQYVGNTDARLEPLRKEIASMNDTLAVIPRDQISSVSNDSRFDLKILFTDSTEIYLEPAAFLRCGNYTMFAPPHEMWYRSRGYLEMGWADNPKTPFAGGFPIVKLSELRHQLETQDTTVMMRYSESLVRKLKNINTWTSDPSVGIFLTNAHRWDKRD